MRTVAIHFAAVVDVSTTPTKLVFQRDVTPHSDPTLRRGSIVNLGTARVYYSIQKPTVDCTPNEGDDKGWIESATGTVAPVGVRIPAYCSWIVVQCASGTAKLLYTAD